MRDMAETHLVKIPEKALKNHCKYLDSESIKAFFSEFRKLRQSIYKLSETNTVCQLVLCALSIGTTKLKLHKISIKILK